jgi:hypothetical protein
MQVTSGQRKPNAKGASPCAVSLLASCGHLKGEDASEVAAGYGAVRPRGRTERTSP